ncbi:MAG: hypothetical protein GY799_18895 [Desulfobulbaceae bacterium]|nr:hypothetical protein [Desulfobulbaceae bacterium]
MMKVFLLLGIITLSSCSLATDTLKSALSGSEDGINIDAQVGSNENKVKTGLGHLGSKTDQVIEDNEGEVSIRNTDGKFHIESEEAVSIVVEETNDLVYYLMGFFFIITMIREFFSWRSKRVK